MLGLLLVLAGTTEPLAPLDLREERAVLLAADSAFAVHASRALLPAFRDVLDEDVIFLDPGERILTVWRRGDAGEWRYVIDGGNDRPQP